MFVCTQASLIPSFFLKFTSFMELAGYASGGHMRSDFSDFDLKNAAEMEAHINMNATAAKINFDKYYRERLNDVSKLWRDVRRRLDVRDVLEVPAFVLDVGVAKFDYSSIGELFHEKLLEKEKNKQARADGTATSLTVNVKANMDDPFKLVVKGCDYTNVDKVVNSIANNTEITHLSLANNGLDTDDCEALGRLVATNHTIVSLDLSNNKLGGENIQKLADALSKNTTLTDVDLGANGLAKSAAKALAVAIAVPSCHISRLQLAGNALGIYGAEELAVGLRANTSIKALGLQNNNIGNDGANKLLEVLPGKNLSIDEAFADGMPPLNDVEGVGAVVNKAYNTSLVQVSIDANRVDDDLMLAVATSTWLNEQVQMRRHLIRLETEARGMVEDVDPELDALKLFFVKATNELTVALAAKAAEAAAAATAKAPPGKGGAKAPAAKPSAAAARSASKSPVKAAPAKGKAPPPPVASAKVKAAAGAGAGARAPSPKKAGSK